MGKLKRMTTLLQQQLVKIDILSLKRVLTFWTVMRKVCQALALIYQA